MINDDLKDLFAKTDEIGGKYQTDSEKKEAQKKLDDAMRSIYKEAALRGKYDLEKGIWIV